MSLPVRAWFSLFQVAGAGSFGFSAALARNHSDTTMQTRTPAYWHGIFPCTARRRDVIFSDEQTDDETNPHQIPTERRLMHESGRWRLFGYDCMSKAAFQKAVAIL